MTEVKSASERRRDLLIAYAELVSEIKELTELKKEYEKELIELLKGETKAIATDAIRGITYILTVSQRKESLRLNTAELKKERPDVYEQFRTLKVAASHVFKVSAKADTTTKN